MIFFSRPVEYVEETNQVKCNIGYTFEIENVNTYSTLVIYSEKLLNLIHSSKFNAKVIH